MARRRRNDYIPATVLSATAVEGTVSFLYCCLLGEEGYHDGWADSCECSKMTVNGGVEGLQPLIVDTIFLCLAIVTIILRFWARSFHQQIVQLNDWLILLALTTAIAQNGIEDLTLALGDLLIPAPEGTQSELAWTNKVGDQHDPDKPLLICDSLNLQELCSGA